MCCAFIAFEKVFDTVLSDYCPCCNGARQRENLLSFLFALYINGLKSLWEGHYVEGLQSISDELESHLNLYIKRFSIL